MGHFVRLALCGTITFLVVHVAAEDVGKPIQVPLKAVTLDTLKSWELPATQVHPFEGKLPIKDASGLDVKGRLDQDQIYYVNPLAGQKVFKVGDKWAIDTRFADNTAGRYTFLIEKSGTTLGVRSYTAMQGTFKNRAFVLLDLNGNGSFADADTDVMVFEQKTVIKVGERVQHEKDEYESKVAPSGSSVTFGKGMGFSNAMATVKADGSIDSGLTLWNNIRVSMGAPPVIRDAKLETWGYKHIAYMKAVGNLQHHEDKGNAAYSDEGHRAGMGSCLGRGSREPLGAIMGQLMCFLHRIPLIQPHLESTSFCVDPAGWSAFDHANGARRKFDWKDPLAYPPDGTTEFLPYWSGNEGPSPIPGGAPKGGVGQPVTLTFPPKQIIKDAKMVLNAEGDGEVEGWVSSPTAPAVAMFSDNLNTVCFIAKQPLKANSGYTATVTGTMNGQAYEKIWKFKTAANNLPPWARGGRGK